jgi:5-(carboxyamino)imidazole ribonucleotide mutase
MGIGSPYHHRVADRYGADVLASDPHESGKVRSTEQAAERGLEVIIAGAGGAAHLPGMVAGHTLLPVIGVPIQSKALNGLDSLLSIVQMPAGVPVATMAIGRAGATNAALLAVAILAATRPGLREQLAAFRRERAEQVMNETLE